MEVRELQIKLHEIHERGFIESHRSGDTGVGKTLEDLLGISENNRESADFIDSNIEVKASREQSSNMLSLFTKEPPRDTRQLWGAEIVEEVGYEDSKGRQALKSTLDFEEPNNQGLYTTSLDDRIRVMHIQHGVCADYPVSVIKNKVEERFPALLLVNAEREDRDGVEYFKYTSAKLYHEFDFESFRGLLDDSILRIDFRMHIKPDGTLRNRGTGWRLKQENYLENIFGKEMKLL